MFSKVRKVVFAGAVVAGLAVYANGCAIIGTIDFGILFRPQQSVRAVDCTTAQVANVKFMFFDQALGNTLRTEVSRPCVPNERYRVSIDLGPYQVRVQGLNGTQVICYESSIDLRVEGGKTDTYNLEAQQHPTGMQGGCVYPTITM
jgi:hypothetical protein